MAVTPPVRSATMQVGRGFIMGAADVVPGVSGGTVALVFGIYQHLVNTIRDGAQVLGRLVRADVRGAWSRSRTIDWAFIVPLLGGILIAVVTLASVIARLLDEYPEEMAGIFFGLVAASTVVAWGMLRRKTAGHLFIIGLVGLIVFVVLGWRAGPVADPSALVFFASGMVAICAMILPGISGSFLLLMLGMYGPVIHAVDDRALSDVAVFAVGAVVGLALFSSLLGWLLDTAFDVVMAALIGLMLGSLRVLWPWPNGVGVISENEEEVVSGTALGWPAGDEWFAPAALGAVAAIVVLAFARYANRPSLSSGS